MNTQQDVIETEVNLRTEPELREDTPRKGTENAGEGPIVMRVRKRDGSLQPVDVNKIVNVALACSTGLKEVDPMRVAAKVISGL
jgi:hypothetical protein